MGKPLAGKRKEQRLSSEFRSIAKRNARPGDDMGRWLKPDVYPLIGAMSLVTGMCVFQLTRNVFLNPDVRVSKSNRQSAVLENAEEGERYSQHAFRRFVSAHRPEVFPAINRFFSGFSAK
ncbi:uncharacterized protein [Aegilops tauschii subsp. strangulata]|nr:uncharacterized protein LOC109786491 [Aegilops tauschii subsp. strangulata]